MIALEKPLRITAETCKSQNLCSEFSEVDLRSIAAEVVSGYDADERSRATWKRRTAAGMDLAMQISKDKSFPWPNCSNVAFPLVTIAALQFHARAYPALISGTDVVKCRATGFEPTPEEIAKADKIGRYMSYQVLEEDTAWEEGQDRLLLNYSIVGCAFKKSYFSSVEGHTVSELVLADNLVLDYFAKSVEKCRRKTHWYPISRNDILEGCRSEAPIYRDVSKEPWFLGTSAPSEPRPRRDGSTPPQPSSSNPFTALEQHVWLDLDADGYEEPYVITVIQESEEVIRIVARWELEDHVRKNSRNQIVSIRATEYFTKYGFIPAPDGSIYDMGFGTLLGPLNESVSSAINQLIDAGTMSTTAGGFLGRGAKIRGGVYTFSPMEWKRIDSTGEDIAKSIYPLPVREPSAVLFNLLALLIDYTNRISGATETMVGENPGQNTPAETSRSMVEQGMKVYAAVFKRTWRCAKEEFKKLYILNAFYAPLRYRELFLEDPNRICPAADPNIVSDSERFMRASAIATRATQVGGYDSRAVEENFLRSLRIDNPKQFYVGIDPASVPEDPKIVVQKLKMQQSALELQARQQEFVATLLEEQRMNQAELIRLHAETVKLMAEAEGEADNRDIVRMQTALAALKTRDDAIRGRIEHLIKIMELESEPERKRVDTTEVRRLVNAPGDSGFAPPPSGGVGQPEGSLV